MNATRKISTLGLLGVVATGLALGQERTESKDVSRPTLEQYTRLLEEIDKFGQRHNMVLRFQNAERPEPLCVSMKKSPTLYWGNKDGTCPNPSKKVEAVAVNSPIIITVTKDVAGNPPHSNLKCMSLTLKPGDKFKWQPAPLQQGYTSCLDDPRMRQVADQQKAAALR